MPYRPDPPSGGDFLGIKQVAVKDIKNNSVEGYDMALDFILQIEGSDFDQKLSLFGNFEWDGENVEKKGLLNRIYRVLDGLGDQGGVNSKGQWVDANDNLIEDVEEYFRKYIDTNKFPYLAYFYKEQNKNTKKVYTRAYPMLVPNTSKGKETLASYIKYMKRNNYLKEYTEDNDGEEIPQENTPLTKFKNQF